MELIHQSLEALSYTKEGTVLVIHEGGEQIDLSDLDYQQIRGLFIWQGEQKLNVFALNGDKFFFGTLIEWEDILKSNHMWDQLSQTMKRADFFPNYLAFQCLDDIADLMSVGEYTQYPINQERQQKHRFIDAVDKWQSGVDMDLLPEGTTITEVEESENLVNIHVKFK